MLTNIVEPKSQLAYSLVQASEATSLSVVYLRKEIRSKSLRAKLVGKRVLILDADLRNWLEEKMDWENMDNRK
jgi:hypothetical protein